MRRGENFIVRTACVVLTSVVMSASAARAQQLFEDTFDTEPKGLNVTDLTNWQVITGNVDVIGDPAFFDLFPGNGTYVDMAGSTNGSLESKTLFELTPGDYELAFDIASNLGGNVLNFSVGSLTNGSMNAPAMFETVTHPFTVNMTTNARILFEEVGPLDAGGSVLDDVRLTRVNVPEPSSVGLLLAGCLGFQVRRSRRTV